MTAVRLPGFDDPHLHLMAMAAERLSVDCSAARTIEDVVALVGAAHATTAAGEWIRATGYDDAFLAERRHPTRADLDRAAPGRAVVLHHRTGHVAVASSGALDALGRPHSPDGVLVDEHEVLARAPRLGRARMIEALARVSVELASVGIVAVTDASVTNGVEEFEFLAGLARDGTVAQRVEVMAGRAHLREFVEQGLSYGAGGARARVGHAKVFAEQDDEPADAIREAHELGFPVAVHVLDVGPLDRTLDALEESPPPAGTTDRIEHCALCLPEQVDRIARVGATVVTNPGFIEHRGMKYLEELSETERAWLYRVGSLLRAGVRVRAASDAPVSAANPLQIMRAAIRRRFGDVAFGAGERITPNEALALVTSSDPGDAVVLDVDPRCTDDPCGAAVLLTIVDGRIVYESPADS